MIWVITALLVVLILLVLVLMWWIGEVVKDLANMIAHVSRQIAGLGEARIDDREAIRAVQRSADRVADILNPRRVD